MHHLKAHLHWGWYLLVSFAMWALVIYLFRDFRPLHVLSYAFLLCVAIMLCRKDQPSHWAMPFYFASFGSLTANLFLPRDHQWIGLSAFLGLVIVGNLTREMLKSLDKPTHH